MSGDDPDDDWFRLEELATRLAELVWVEERLFELLGRWSTIDANDGARILFATASRHHGWHSEVLRQCLPTSPQLADRSIPRPPTAGWARAIEQLSEVVEADQTVARLLCVARQFDPWVEREFSAIQDLCRPVADAALFRWLRFASIDHDHDGRAISERLDALQEETVSLDAHAISHSIHLAD